jgi:hypothetical protein
MSNGFKTVRLFNNIDTVNGYCDYCGEEGILVAIVPEYYRCTNCGEDTKQHINGSIRYLKLNEDDRQWLKRQKASE